MSTALLDRKFENWQNQLLDLGKRNKMINYRETSRATLKLLEPNFEEIFKRIAVDEEELTFQRPIDKNSDTRTYSILSLLENLSCPIPVSIGDIKSEGSILERQKTLKQLRSKSRLALDEQGTNILYLVSGFVEWREKNTASSQWVKSPLILTPVSLMLDSLNAPYVLKKYEDDIVVNPTLAYLFERDYGIILPSFDSDEQSITDFMDEMEELVDRRGWRIVRESSIGLVSFLKISMYKDLCNNEDDIKKNPIIRAFAGEENALTEISEELYDYEHDKESSVDNYQVLNADSSQQDAILLSKKGISFVMQGPPGTGKSQTIANIISQGLADGKRILFVSEKAAALEVVYKRLREVHLDDFCLALHSYKANKKEILEELGKSLGLSNIKVKEEEIAKLTELDMLKEALQKYVTDIHEEILPFGKSLYEVFGILSSLEEAIELPLELEDVDKMTIDQVNRLGILVMDFDKAKTNLGDTWYKNPWNGTVILNVSHDFSNQIKDNFSRVVHYLRVVLQDIEKITSVTGGNITLTINEMESFRQLISLFIDCTDIPSSWIGSSNLFNQIKAIAESMDIESLKADECRRDLEAIFNKKFFQISASDKLSKIQYIDEIISKYIKTDKSSWNLYISYIKSESEYLGDCYKVFDKILQEANQIANKLEIIAPNNVDELAKCYHVAYVLGKKHTVIDKWFENETKETLKSIEAYENICCILECKEKELTEICDIAVAKDENYLEIEKSEDLISNLEINSEINSYTFAELKNYVDKLDISHNQVKLICDELYGDISEKIGTLIELPQYFEQIDKSICIIKFLIKNTLPGEKWYDLKNEEIFEGYINQCIEKQEKYKKLKNEIEQEWDREIYQLDYKAYMTRFKTEYNSLFKILKKSYREDMKVLKGLHHATYGTLKNASTIIMSMEKLAEIDELKSWFADNEETLKDWLGGKFHNIDTDFNEIREDRISFKECYLYDGIGSKLLIYIGRYNRQEQAYYLRMSELLEKLMGIIENTKLQMFYQKQTIIEGTHSQEEYISRINVLLDTYANMKKFIYKAEQIKVCDFINLVGLVKTYRDIQNQKDIIDEDLKEKLGDKYVTDTEGLQEIKNGIQAVDEIKDNLATISEKIKEMMLTHSTIENIEYTEENVKGTVDMICERMHISNKTNISCEGLQRMVEELLYSCDEIQSESDDILACRISDAKEVELVDCLEKLSVVQKYTLNLHNNKNEYVEKFGRLYNEENTNWNDIVIIIEKTKVLNCLLDKLNLSIKQGKTLLQEAVNSNIELKHIEDDIEKILECEHIISWICSLFDGKIDFKSQELAKTYARWNSCLEKLSTLDAWIDFRECRKKCYDNGLQQFVQGAEDAYYQSGELINSFKKMFYLKWTSKICAGIESVSQFRTRIQNGRIDRFCELDSHQLPVAQMRIREKLIADMPNKNNFNRATDEMGVLMHELNKKRSIMPLRKLFKTIPNLVLKLKPCMMMSPLSVSYFLEAETYKFDMVIFDEASQIFPQDAIGAICRGKQVIIAGDSKQLPPTSFFTSNTNNSDADYDIDDAEDEIYDSILEEATNSMPNRSLLWHYRSRNEDLISFSNQEIYKNTLITFPSSKTMEMDSGVEYVYVENGVYAGRRNAEEAKKCVELVKNHIIKHPERSLGIIAFSESQQATIEDEVQKFREENPRYEFFFSEEKEEPFFVKNLENVQGDERDSIIFSICYAKDANGRMYMRFGPLGHQGGERRLNVAITRAKDNVKLVGSIMPYDIDLDKTKSEGVRMLRDYMEFAIKGNAALKPYKNPSNLYDKDMFCDSICLFLSKKGYTVKQYVGTSSYKIDIAVEHPKHQGCYVAGIECDGNSYYVSRTTRDREHLRKTVLEHMGWKMFRIWSTEWINNRESEEQRMLDFINEAIVSYEKGEQRQEQSLPKKSDNVKVEVVQKKVEEPTKLSFPYYQVGDWRMAEYNPYKGNLENLAARIRVVVKVEQPIHLEVLYRRLASAFGNEKATKPVRETIDLSLKRVMANEVVIEDGFVRFKDFTDIRARIPKGVQDRNIEYISKLEIADAMKAVIKNSYGITREDLCAETTSIFGYDRMGPKISKAMNETIEYMLKKNMVYIIDDKMHIKED